MTRTPVVSDTGALPTVGNSVTRSLVTDPRVATSQPLPADRALARRPRVWRRYRPELTVAGIAMIIFSWGIATVAPWRDELVTLEVADRPTSDILDLVGTVDLVHATYYLLVHGVFGASVTLTGVRMISVLAAVATAVLLVRIGRELDAPHVGLAAGLLFAVSPLASRYAQEARPYALVTCAVTASVLALLQACRQPWRRRRWAVYALTVAATALLNVLALTVLLVHALQVLVATRGWIRRTWAITTGATLLILAPFVLGAVTQRGQVSWLTVPPLSELRRFFLTEYQPWQLVVLVLAAAVFLVPLGTHRHALGLGVAWGVLPPAVLWAVSQVHPLFAIRYVVIAVPGAALALAAIMPALVTLAEDFFARRPHRPTPRPGMIRMLALVPVAAIALYGLPAQLDYRSAVNGHAENVTGVARYLATRALPGDAVMYVPGELRIIALANPDAFRLTDDVALAQSPERSTTIYGKDVSSEEMQDVLAGRRRVWVITGSRGLNEQRWPADVDKVDVLAGYHLQEISYRLPFQIRLYTATSPERH